MSIDLHLDFWLLFSLFILHAWGTSRLAKRVHKLEEKDQ